MRGYVREGNKTVIDSRLPGCLGIPMRRSQSGPESDLVDWFLASVEFTVPDHWQATVFREPFLVSGCPDLVVVLWNPEVARQWPSARSALGLRDTRVLQLLVSKGRLSVDEVEWFLAGNLDDSFERLETAGMLVYEDGGYVTAPLQRIMAVRRILAIEAKVADWRRALEQAYLNTWFSTESYVLVPELPGGAELLEAARRKGIGVWTKADPRPQKRVAPVQAKLPISYASWMFNEWAWRVALHAADL